MPLLITASAAAVLGLLLVWLAARISMMRMRGQVSLGDGNNPSLGLAIRLHGNTVEHVPLFLVLCLVAELHYGSVTWLVFAAGAFAAARLLYTWGMLRKHFTRERQLGALLTYAVQGWLALALAFAVLTR
jgi:uncharacterized protein